ncbi:helix-hairpin-helix domain-containing protein [Streptomyces sp. BBFR2]|uniref:helix-hairpin-helix domain-containing protein n=1 Tax=Streptomyces sp. BBFR2 TaxID=3372854 RepID=UPI0037D9F082
MSVAAGPTREEGAGREAEPERKKGLGPVPGAAPASSREPADGYEPGGGDTAAPAPTRYGDPRPPGLGLRERVRLAVGERLPVWVQARCGTEPRALVALGVLLVVALGFAVQHFWSGGPEQVRAPAAERVVPGPAGARRPEPSGAASVPGAVAGGAAGRQLVVDVVGKVAHPGVRRLPAGARVMDALAAAGGVLRGASTQGLNRARVLADGEQIVVGGPGAGTGPGGGANGPPGAASSGSSGGLGGPGAAAPGQPVSLNSATVEQLDTLPGVGPVLAQHIVEFRTRHGGFTSVNQLREVTGIGDRKFADLRPLVQP